MFIVRFTGFMLMVMFCIILHYVPNFMDCGGFLMPTIAGVLLVAPTKELEYPSEYEARMKRKKERQERSRIRKISILRRLKLISDTEYQRLVFNC